MQDVRTSAAPQLTTAVASAVPNHIIPHHVTHRTRHVLTSTYHASSTTEVHTQCGRRGAVPYATHFHFPLPSFFEAVACICLRACVRSHIPFIHSLQVTIKNLLAELKHQAPNSCISSIAVAPTTPGIILRSIIYIRCHRYSRLHTLPARYHIPRPRCPRIQKPFVS